VLMMRSRLLPALVVMMVMTVTMSSGLFSPRGLAGYWIFVSRSPLVKKGISDR